jgi:hypothetical protein
MHEEEEEITHGKRRLQLRVAGTMLAPVRTVFTRCVLNQVDSMLCDDARGGTITTNCRGSLESNFRVKTMCVHPFPTWTEKRLLGSDLIMQRAREIHIAIGSNGSNSMQHYCHTYNTINTYIYLSNIYSNKIILDPFSKQLRVITSKIVYEACSLVPVRTHRLPFSI